MYALVANPHIRAFVVLLDQLHVTIAGAHASRQPLVNTLNRLIGPDDLFAVMTQNTDPRALTFGRRLESIAAHLAEYWDWGERYRIGLDVTDPMEQKLKDCFEFKPSGQHPPWMVSDNGQIRYLYELLIDRRREDRTLTALERLVDQMSGMREARTVALVITEGWRLFPEDRQLADESREYGAHMPAVGISGGQIVVGDRSGVTTQGSCVRALEAAYSQVLPVLGRMPATAGGGASMIGSVVTVMSSTEPLPSASATGVALWIQFIPKMRLYS